MGYKSERYGQESGVSYPAVAMGLGRLEEQMRREEAMKMRYEMLMKSLDVKC